MWCVFTLVTTPLKKVGFEIDKPSLLSFHLTDWVATCRLLLITKATGVYCFIFFYLTHLYQPPSRWKFAIQRSPFFHLSWLTLSNGHSRNIEKIISMQSPLKKVSGWSLRTSELGLQNFADYPDHILEDWSEKADSTDPRPSCCVVVDTVSRPSQSTCLKIYDV